MADWLEPGAKAPAFTLPADDGSKVKLSDLKGSPVVLYFYPADDTPGVSRPEGGTAKARRQGRRHQPRRRQKPRQVPRQVSAQLPSPG
jgi:peroxiredoxin